MKKHLFIELIGSFFILLFVYTSLSKLYDHDKFRAVLSVLPLAKSFATGLSYAIPVLELGIAGLLFVPRTRVYGLWFSFALMAIFTWYVTQMVATERHLPCSCGGVLQKMSWTQHIIFNAVSTTLAGTALLLRYRGSKTDEYLPSSSSYQSA